MENSRGQNRSSQQDTNKKKKRTAGEDMTRANSDRQVTSPSRGGTTDMDHRALRSASGASSRPNRGSGISTKRNVTGSDYDGQVSEG